MTLGVCTRMRTHKENERVGISGVLSPPLSSLANYHYGDAIASSPDPQPPNPNNPQACRLYGALPRCSLILLHGELKEV